MRYRIEVSSLIIVKALDTCPYLETAVPDLRTTLRFTVERSLLKAID